MATIDQVIEAQLARVGANSDEFTIFIAKLLDSAAVLYENVVEDVIIRHVPLDVVTQMMDAIAVDFPAVPILAIPNYSVPAVPDISFTVIEHSITVLEAARAQAERKAAYDAALKAFLTDFPKLEKQGWEALTAAVDNLVELAQKARPMAGLRVILQGHPRYKKIAGRA